MANYTEHFDWFKNASGWVLAVTRYYADGEPQREYVEWGLSDKEYFKLRLKNG